MIFGYARVSTIEQNLDRQIDALKAEGAEEIIEEKMTGTKADRPQLNLLLDKLRAGDIILISDLTRLSRSTKDLFALVDKIEKKGANIRSLKESWLDTTTPQGKLMFTFMAGISQFERDLISQRTKEGLAAARARGRSGGRREKLDSAKKKAIYDLYTQKQTKLMDICNMFDITKPTLYKVVEEISKLKSGNIEKE
ncbi:recombinase family protein [Clostridium beijerinckii]|uniref:DNA invertase Pin-like site-specific DNA recombinase n=1 Tax=Clostridium beijerinckii TaxID=1520 RepID=A0AAE5LRW1_CLOBE|nr:recombinase family protein [Clostridium beijerinckii]NOW85324.1 DNA invertase Pin-like site-specific DNA recombinase [Clostridium beijerinckii]NSB16471.1 DNA invertase Pin-like site-specific DNA recombinase [Clostridium beijerinckii]OOM25676.1 DNA-invertase hin [Clostridium beijerinckii]